MLRKIIYCSTIILLAVLSSHAQDSIVKRIIFIGDAGEINHQQSSLIPDAAKHILPNKTTVLFLGDNIYPTGMALASSSEAEKTKQILRSQFVPMRNAGASVYFIPGNHDWDRMGKDGYAKIREQGNFIAAQNDSLLKMVPENGCVGPYEINVSDSLVIIAFDSEWWLFPHKKLTAGCDCENKKEFTDKLLEILYRNRYKMILLAAHHPFQSYGHHGGYYSLKDHLFPLTAVNKNFYLPLPVIGSLYPLLRSTLQSPEDRLHPLYQDMIKQVDGVFKDFPNLVHVAGHEHGLQLIKSNQLQIVSGSGAKEAFVKNGKYSLFAEKNNGFVTVDQLQNNHLKITFYALHDSTFAEAFTYTQPYVSIKQKEDSVYSSCVAMGDSAIVKANESYGEVSGLHKALFGENYRKEWSTDTKLSVIKISEINGGLTPIQRGGGHQSLSLRLKDKNGKEWVLRSVNKYPEILLPEPLRETFAKDIITDAMSAQHPYSALVVPTLAEAAGVPHANPIIGIVAPDRNLGIYIRDFMNTVCLLEEREPMGKSDNSEKMYKTLLDDNDNSFDTTTFFKARLLDLFIGDWDRHEDQWRWVYGKNEKKGKNYVAVPRDRDQVFHIVEGLVPNTASRPWIAPLLHDFDGNIKQVNAFFTESNGLNKKFLNQLSHEQWMELTKQFVAVMTDSVLEKALRNLPKEAYNIRHDELLQKLKERRSNMAAAMDKYYAFINKIVDIQTTDKNEFVQIVDAVNGGLLITVHKMNKEGKIKDELFKRTFYPNITKEIRFYVEDGNDSVVVNHHSKITIRIIGAKNNKAYNIVETNKTIQLYGRERLVNITGNLDKVRTHLSNDSINTAYIPANSYNKIIPILNVGYNIDDGVMLGAAIKFINQGFRKKPYSSMQQFSFTRSFSTDAFKFTFNSEWLNVFGKADFVFKAKALAPDNTQNFFGVGNNTAYDKDNSIKYYRSRFALYEVSPELRWRKKTSTYSIAPFFQFYQFDADDNKNRLINVPSLIHSYDSSIISKDKSYLGIAFSLMKDARNNKLIPSSGGYVSIKVQAYKGLNEDASNFVQIVPEMTFFRKLDSRANIILANRFGGGATLGKAAFYQQLFLGGHENLLGYRQYRFAGKYMLYNNFELRLKLAEVGSYILPGQLGVVGFYDAGKVWAKGYNNDIIHQSTGAGIYFMPAQIGVIQLLAGYSKEGWYPYLTFGFRF